MPKGEYSLRGHQEEYSGIKKNDSSYPFTTKWYLRPNYDIGELYHFDRGFRAQKDEKESKEKYLIDSEIKGNNSRGKNRGEVPEAIRTQEIQN